MTATTMERKTTGAAPRISVIMAHHNRGRYVEEAVDSALAQRGDFELVEVLVVDDHSDDPDSLEALKRIGRNDRVRVLHNKGPQGPSAPRNVGIQAARGDWIAFLDSDDLWLEGSLAARAQIAGASPACQWVGGDFVLLHDDGSRDPEGFIGSCSYNGPIVRRAQEDGSNHLKRPVAEFIQGYLTWTCTTMVRRDLLDEVGGFDETLVQAEDRDLWMRLALVADFWFVPEVLALYRQHDSNIVKTPEPPNKWDLRAYAARLADARFRPYRRVLRSEMAKATRKQARFFRARGEFRPAFRAYAQLIRLAPFHPEGWRGLASSAIGKK